MWREINFGESRILKFAILIDLDGLNFEFDEFLQFLKAEISQINKWQKLQFYSLQILKNWFIMKSI